MLPSDPTAERSPRLSPGTPSGSILPNAVGSCLAPDEMTLQTDSCRYGSSQKTFEYPRFSFDST